jgi:hypothetical protein
MVLTFYKIVKLMSVLRFSNAYEMEKFPKGYSWNKCITKAIIACLDCN